MAGELAGKTIIFIHPFRSGGTTLNRVMDWEYDPRRVFSLNGRYRAWAYRRLTYMPAASLASLQVVRGHMAFGVHRLLPQEATYVTVFRDPVRRILSEYFAGVFRITHQHHRMIRRMSVQDFVANLANNNAQTRMVAGLGHADDFMEVEPSPQMLEVAKRNLREHFSLVGITERFDETLALAKHLFGWRVPCYARFNVRGRSLPVTPNEVSYIEGRNALDLALYAYARDLFEEALARHAAELPSAGDTPLLASGPHLFYYRLTSMALQAYGLGASLMRCLAASRPCRNCRAS